MKSLFNTAVLVFAGLLNCITAQNSDNHFDLFSPISETGTPLSQSDIADLSPELLHYELNSEILDEIYTRELTEFSFDLIATDGQVMTLLVQRTTIYAGAAKIGAKTPNGIIEMTDPNLYYRGEIIGETDNWVALSFTPEYFSALVVDQRGNWNLGQIKNDEKYCLYNDLEFGPPLEFNCQTMGGDTETKEKATYTSAQKSQTCPLELFWISDYDFYLQNSMNTTLAILTVGNLFNNVATLFHHEGVEIALKSNYVYTFDDQYPEDAYAAFLQFGPEIHQDPLFWDHDLAMLLSHADEGQVSGVGVIDAFCHLDYAWPDQSDALTLEGRFATSRIIDQYSEYPNYSHNVFVVSHEMGHNLGSRHTHWCGWPDGPIDNCSWAEPDANGNSCADGPPPSDGGTVMSYCNFVLGNIILTNGFGPYPNAEINADISNNMDCICQPLGAKEITSAEDFEMYPNPVTDELYFSGNVLVKKGVIIDALGRVQLSFNDTYIVDCSSLSAGTYFVSIYTETEVITQKMVKR